MRASRKIKFPSLSDYIQSLCVGLVLFGTILSAIGQSLEQFRATTANELIQRCEGAGAIARRQIEDALMDKRAEALPELRLALQEPNPETKRWACALLARIHDKGAIDAHIALTHDGNEDSNKQLSKAEW
jgi:hypothetical protein